MTLWESNLAVISKGLPRLQPPAHEPTLTSKANASAGLRVIGVQNQPRTSRQPRTMLALLDWIRTNVDPSSGPTFHFVMLEYYTEMLLERGWRELKWNPVAHQFRLITTGNRKVYAWVQTTTGTPHRLRVYPIPPSAFSSAIPEMSSSATSSSADAAPKLRRAA